MDQIAEVIGGGTPDTRDPANFGGPIPWITPADMSTHIGKTIIGGARSISEQGLSGSGARWLPQGTVLFSSRAPIGYTAVAACPVTTNQGFKSFVLREGIASDYVYHWLTSAKQHAEKLASGTTFLEISGAKAALIPFPLAPIAEQTRIVEKLEELLSDLDAGVAELKAAQRKLAQYRQSLLKAAVEGALTADWRAALAQSGDTQETGPALLQRILTERRTRWETGQLARFAEQGKTPPKGWQAKYPEPTGPSMANLEELPAGWAWATLDQVVTESLIGLDRGHDHQSLFSGNAGYVKMNNISMDGDVDTSAIVRIEASKEEIGRYSLVPGDLLFNTRNSRELVGKTGIVREADKVTVYNNNLMRLRFDGAITSEFLCSQMCAPEFRRRMEKVKKATTSVAAVYAKDLFPLPIIVPPMDEQIAIGDMLTTYLKAVDEQSAAVSKGLNQAAAQRKNILKAAFAGQLVPQDPNDEPASVLLERIRAERAHLPTARGVRRTGSNRAPATSSPSQSKRGRRPRTTA